jgi:hypothetical protein
MLSGVYTHLRFSYKVCCFYVVRSLHTPPLFILGVLFHGVRSLLPPPLFIKGVCRLVLKLPPRSGSVFEMRIRIQVLKLKKKGQIIVVKFTKFVTLDPDPHFEYISGYRRRLKVGSIRIRIQNTETPDNIERAHHICMKSGGVCKLRIIE